MQRARILIVDDEEGMRRSMKTVLEDKGCIADTAENGQEAIAKCKSASEAAGREEVQRRESEREYVESRAKEQEAKSSRRRSRRARDAMA